MSKRHDARSRVLFGGTTAVCERFPVARPAGRGSYGRLGESMILGCIGGAVLGVLYDPRAATEKESGRWVLEIRTRSSLPAATRSAFG